MTGKLEAKKDDFELNDLKLSVAANIFSLFQNQKPKLKHFEEDEDAIREYEDNLLIKETPKPKPPPPPPKAPPRNNANSKLFASIETLEKSATNMLSCFMTSNQMELLPEAVRNFVVLNPGFILNLMKDHGVIAQQLQFLSYSELMQLYRYQHNVNQLVDAGISMPQLFSLDSTSRSIIIYNADAIVSLMKSGSTFDQLSKMSNNDLMNCVHEHQASEAAQSSVSASQGP